ncbi:MAG: dienelactone hydrolase family protein, partial [Pseudomonadales bacterium]
MPQRLLGILFLSLSFAISAENTHNGDTSFSSPSEISEADWQDPAELQRVWQESWVNFPVGYGETGTRTIREIVSANNKALKKLPTVIFLHGCAGMLRGEKRRVSFFAANGYAVISPISFARKKYPRSCSIFPKRAFLYRGTLKLRQYDIAYAIQKARQLDWVDENNIFLVGHSEGAILATTFEHAEAGVNARVAESWTCQSDWLEYLGVNAPASEPVLTLVSKNDPWFRKPPTKGSCDSFLDNSNGSQSMVYEDAVTKGKHKVLDYPQVQQQVLNFMK